MAYFVIGFSLAYAGLLFFITSLTCGALGEPAEKCDIRVWYLTMIGEGTFSKDLTNQQQEMKLTIEGMIQKSTENQELSKVDCSVLAMFESMFKDPQTDKAIDSGSDSAVNGTKIENETKIENPAEADPTGGDDSEIADDPTEMEFDETEMVEDETESAETEETEGADDTVEDGRDKTGEALVNISSNSSDVQKVISNDTSGPSSNDTRQTHRVDFWTKTVARCNKQKPNKTRISCTFLNAANFQCPAYPADNFSESDTVDKIPLSKSGDAIDENGKVHDGELQMKNAENDTDSKTANLGNGQANSKSKDEHQSDSKSKDEAENDFKIKHDTLQENNSAQISREKSTEDNAVQDPVNTSKTIEQEDPVNTSKTIEQEEESVRHSRQSQSVNSVDLDQFRMLIEQKTGEYTFKIQTLETQIIRLENQLLMEKLNKQNHSSSFNRLENQILRLENELLKMTLGYDEIKAENESIKKKQKNFLELDYVKRPGEDTSRGDNSTKHFELINKHQNKISELTDHLQNQSRMIEKIRGQSDFLEEQNRVLFQIVMNQTMLVSQMMKKVQSLSDSNLKHQMEQHQIQQKLQIALASSHVMEDLNSLVSDRMSDRPDPRVSDTLDKESPLSDERYLEKVRKLTRRTADNDDENIKLHKYLKQTHPLTLYGCKQLKRCKVKCQLNSFLVGKCLPSDNSSTVGGFIVDDDKRTPNDVISNTKTQEEKDVKTKESSTDNEMVKTAESEKKEKSNGSKIQDKEPSELKVELTKDQPLSEEKTISKEHAKSTGDDKDAGVGETSNGKDDKQSGVKEANGKLGAKLETPGVDGTKEKLEQKKKSEVTKNDTKLSSDSVPASSNETQSDQPKLQETSGNSTIAQNKEKEDKKPDSQPPNDKVEQAKTGKPKPKTKNEAKKPIVQKIPPLYNVTKQVEPKDCYDYYRRSSGNKKDGQYKIRLHGTEDLVPVFCDMKNGGWTVIQRRQDGTVNFFKTWNEYKKGFGGVFGEHWLGNDIIHRLTNQAQYELRVDMTDFNKTKKHALYEYIRIENEAEGYRLHVDGYSGDAGDGFSKHHGEKFSTKDKDNDKVVKEFGGSCANRFKGAWWYYKCYASNLNGKFYKKGKIPEKLFDGITWKPWTGPNISLKKVEIKVRPISVKR